MKLGMPIFAMKFCRLSVVGGFGIFQRSESTEKNPTALENDTGNVELTISVKPDSFYTVVGIGTDGTVLNVLLSGGGSKISPTIVVLIRVAMVNVVRRVVARNQFPNYAMGIMQRAIDTHREITLISATIYGKSRLPRIPGKKYPVDGEVDARSHAPGQDACLRVIIEALAQIRLRWQNLGSHRCSFSAIVVRAVTASWRTRCGSSQYAIGAA